jgi:uncharacterized protein YuzE
MTVRYDQSLDVLTIILQETSAVQESDELADGVVADYVADGRLVGLEIHDAHTQADLGEVALESLPIAHLTATLPYSSTT